MTSDRINTGAAAVLKSLGAAEEEKERRLVRFVVTYTGWLLLFFVWGIYLLSSELRARGPLIYGWLLVHLAYQIVLEMLSRAKKKSYETPGFRMARTQVMLFLGSALVLLTGGAESYFWFVYLWPLFASALYFSWPVTWRIYGEVAVLYFLSSLVAAGGFASINFALLLTNLAVLFVLTAVLRYLVESIRKHEAAERALGYSELLQQVQQDVDAAIDLQDVLGRILRRAVDLVEARDGSLMLMEEDGKLHFRARFGYPFPVDKEERTFTPGTPDEGIAGWVARNRKPYVCRDTEPNSKFVDIIAGPSIRSLVSVPIISHGTVLGVINVDRPEPDRFSGTDVELLVALADQVAVAIERAELLESLKQISEKTLGGAEDPHQHIMDAVHRLIRCPAAMWRVDETRKQAKIVASRGVGAEYLREAVVDLDRRSVTGRAIREREIVQVLDIQADPDFQNKEAAAREGWQSYLAVPLLAGPERAVGTLSIYSTIKRENFTRWELDLLRTFARQAGVVIRNADLAKELVALNEIGQAVSVLGVEAIANLVYHRTSGLMDTTNFFLCLYDKDREELNFQIWIYDGEPLEPFSCELSDLTGWVVREKKSLLIRDWDEEEQDFPVKAGIVTERQRSWLGVPLLMGKEIIGVISVQSPEPYAFNLDTQRLLEIIASQAAIAIQNARHYKQLQEELRQTKALYEIGQALSAELDYRGVLELILKEAKAFIPFEHGSVNLIDERLNSLVMENSIGLPEGIEQVHVKTGEGITGWVAKYGRPLCVADVRDIPEIPGVPEQPDYMALVENTRSELCVPLRIKGKLIGVLNVEAPQIGVFDKRDQEQLETLASQAAIAIENARLYEQRSNDIAALQEVNEAITTASWTEIAELVTQKAKELTQAEYAGVWVMDEDQNRLVLGALYGREPIQVWLPIDEHSINGWVALTGKTHNCPDVSQDPRYLEWYEDVKSSITVPMRFGGRVIGTLYTESFELSAFSDYQLGLLQSLADQAAIAIENARLYGQRVKDLAALQEVNEAIVSEGWDKVSQLVVDKAVEVMPGEYSSLWLKEPATGDLVLQAASGPAEAIDRESNRLNAGEDSISIRVAETGNPNICRNVEEDPGFHRIYQPAQSSVTVPLEYQGKVIGVLNVESSQLKAFAEQHSQLLESFADQAAIAIENAELFAQLNRERLELRSRLINAERLLVASRFAASYIHRVNNLVGTIPIRVMQIKERLSDTPDVLRMLEFYLDGILDDARGVSPITEELTELTREEPKRELVDVLNALARVARRVRIETPAEISLEENYPEERLWVQAVAWELSEAFWNVLKNGAEAMLPDGGILSLSVTKVSDEVGPIWIEIRIHNTGPKIPTKILNQIFEPFRSSKGSSGYGLWRTQHVIQDLGGSISIENDDNELPHGVATTIRLPIIIKNEVDHEPLEGGMA